MADVITVGQCPCCGGKANWTKGDKETRMLDSTQCLDCFLTAEGDYEPMSSLRYWNVRAIPNSYNKTQWSKDGSQL